jgi:hypothetical protein
MFPRSLAQHIGILLTNVPSVLSRNFTQDALPDALRGDNYHPFWIDNPVALWKKYNEIHQGGTSDVDEEEMEEMMDAIKVSHEKVLKELVKLFDWVVDLKPQHTKDVRTLYEKSQEIERSIADALSRATQLENKKKELENGRGLAKRHQLVGFYSAKVQYG